MLRKFSINAFTFYMDHVNETKVARENFLHGEAFNPDVIPPHIYESWRRCAAYGVNPYSAQELGESKKTVYRNSEQILLQFPDVVRSSEEFRKVFGFQFVILNTTNNTMVGLTPDGKLDYKIRTVSEELIGTTSASLCLADQKATTCFGYQNYITPFSRQFGLSLPVFGKNGLSYILTAVLNPMNPTNSEYMRAALFLEMLGDVFESNMTIEESNASALKLIQSGLSKLSEGLVAISRNGEYVEYNPAALKLLNLDRNTEPSQLAGVLKNALKKQGKAPESTTIVRNSEIMGDVYILRQAQRGKTPKISALEDNVATYTFQSLLGNAPNYRRAKNDAFVIAPTDASVLLLGETGVGKELFAQSIHNASKRKNSPFVAINCGSVSKDLLESELFGYEPGAFTGASNQGKIGVFEAASGGTLFLDEIESLSLHAQAALLRCLSSGFIQRIGSVKPIPIDLRLISATKVDLLTKAGQEWGVKFRPDLYYRLSTCIISIPALRERKGDIEVLARHMVNRYAEKMGFEKVSIADSFLEALKYYDWPGNVRELENVIERAIIFMNPERRVLDRSLLYPSLLNTSDRSRLVEMNREDSKNMNGKNNMALHQEEILTIQKFLSNHNFNVNDAAKELGISRQTLYRKIQSSEILSKMMEQSRREKKIR